LKLQPKNFLRGAVLNHKLYSENESNLIAKLYEKGMPIKDIVCECNKAFWNSKKIRTYKGLEQRLVRLYKDGRILRRRATSNYSVMQLTKKKKKILELALMGYKNNEISRMTSESITTVKSAINYLRAKGLLNKELIVPTVTPASGDIRENLKKQILKDVKSHPLSLGELSFRYDRSKNTIIEMIDELKKEGWDIDIKSDSKKVEVDLGNVFDKDFKSIDVSSWHSDTLKMGVVADTHLGSRSQQLTLLHSAYEIFEKENVNFVVHGGDVIEGALNHAGHIYQRFLHSADEFKDYTIEKYPKSKKFKTHVISGFPHDLAFKFQSGYNIVRAICEKRTDMIYEGEVRADFKLKGKYKIRLFHPSGGMAYAKSYHAQKFLTNMIFQELENCQNPNDIPKVMIIAHYHQLFWFPEAGVHVIGGGCFQSEYTYLVAKGLKPQVGFCIYTFTFDDKNNAIKIEPQFYNWSSKIIKNDY